MRARVYDKDSNQFYISEIYGILNRGTTWYLVDSLSDPERIVLAGYLDFSSKPSYSGNVEIIDNNICGRSEWVYKEKEEMKRLDGAVGEPGRYHYFRGYAFIWERQEALARLVCHGSIGKKEIGADSVSTRLPEWNYIESREDIDQLMKGFGGFHDSVMKEFSYVTGDYVSQDGVMHLSHAGEKRIRVVFESQWAKGIEMILLAPRYIQLVPPGENYMGDLYDASLFIKDCMVYFYDSYMESMPETYRGTMFAAMGLMWRELNGEC